MSSTRKPSSVSAALARRSQVDRHLAGVLSTMNIGRQQAGSAAVLGTNRRFGRDVGRIAAKAADTVDLCPRPFRRLTTTPAQARADIARLAELEDCEASIERTRQQVRAEISTIRVRLGDFAAQVYTATQSTLDHPFWDAGEQAELRTAAQPFLGAIEERAATIRTAMTATRARNAEAASQAAETEARLSQLEIENRFLAGEELRPADLHAAAPPSAARRKGRSRRAPGR